MGRLEDGSLIPTDSFCPRAENPRNEEAEEEEEDGREDNVRQWCWAWLLAWLQLEADAGWTGCTMSQMLEPGIITIYDKILRDIWLVTSFNATLNKAESVLVK